MNQYYDPPGLEFKDATGKHFKIVTDGHMKGWLVRKHPDGQWVTQRQLDLNDTLKIIGELRFPGLQELRFEEVVS